MQHMLQYLVHELVHNYHDYLIFTPYQIISLYFQCNNSRTHCNVVVYVVFEVLVKIAHFYKSCGH